MTATQQDGPIRVMLVDDHEVVRQGLRALLESQGDIEVVGEAGDGAEAIERAAELRPPLMEALNAGAVDFGSAGEAPPIFAQAAGIDLVYLGAEPASEAVEAILVPTASPIHDVAGLKGRKVAVQKGSSANFLLVAALEKAGLSFKDIQPVYLPPADAPWPAREVPAAPGA